MENEENQNQVSLRFPPPLEIAPRFPQSHNPDDDSPLPKTQNQKVSHTLKEVGMLGIDYPSKTPAADLHRSSFSTPNSKAKGGPRSHVGGAHASPALQPPKPRRQMRQYLVKMTGLSRAQITRLNSNPPANRFARKYTPADGTAGGSRPTKPSAARPRARSSSGAVQQREYSGWRGSRWPRSQSLPPAAAAFRRFCEWIRCIKGIRGVKGVYHINAVDEVTQWQVVAAVAESHDRAVSLSYPRLRQRQRVPHRTVEK